MQRIEQFVLEVPVSGISDPPYSSMSRKTAQIAGLVVRKPDRQSGGAGRGQFIGRLAAAGNGYIACEHEVPHLRRVFILMSVGVFFYKMTDLVSRRSIKKYPNDHIQPRRRQRFANPCQDIGREALMICSPEGD